MTDLFRNMVLLLLMGTGLLAGSCGDGKQEVAPPLPVIQEMLEDTASAYYIDPLGYSQSMKMLPIGVIGNSADDLQVVETLLGLDEFDNITGKPGSDGLRDFAGEHVEFLCLPSFETLSREDMIRQIVRLFRQQDQRPPVKALVVAGDLVPPEVYDDLKDLIGMGNLGIITVSVIQAGNDKALEYVHKNNAGRDKRLTVGVIATDGAFSINAYDCLADVTQVVFQAYEDKETNSTEKAIRFAMTSLADKLPVNNQARMKYIVLGAHPLLQHRELIPELLTFLRNYRKDDRYVYRDLLDSDMILIEPQKEAGIQLYRAMREERLAAFRTTPSCVRVYEIEKPDLTKYPLLNVCINN